MLEQTSIPVLIISVERCNALYFPLKGLAPLWSFCSKRVEAQLQELGAKSETKKSEVSVVTFRPFVVMFSD